MNTHTCTQTSERAVRRGQIFSRDPLYSLNMCRSGKSRSRSVKNQSLLWLHDGCVIVSLSLNYDTPVLPEYLISNALVTYAMQLVYEKRLAYLVIIQFPCF